MNAFKKYSNILTDSIIILLFIYSTAFSQAPFERDLRKSQDGGFGPPREAIVIGEMISIDDSKISLLSQDGEKIDLAISPMTFFVRENPMGRNQIKKGDRVFVAGQHSTGNAISAITINILEEVGGEKAVKRPMQSAQQGFGGRETGTQGPITGFIIELEPLTIRDDSGETKVIIISEITKISKHISVSRADIGEGTMVKVIAPRVPGREREANKVIIISKEDLTAMKGGNKSPYKFNGEVKTSSAGEYFNSPFGMRDAPLHPEIYSDLGIHWAGTGVMLASWNQVEKVKGVYNFDSVDRNIFVLYQQGLNIVVELRPTNRLYGTQFVEFSQTGGTGKEYPEGHESEYGAFVERFVERYDGDGVNDAPGSPVIKHYQLVHEVPPKNPIFIQYWRENPEKYAKLFALTYKSVKNACADCNLYLSGAFTEDFQTSTGEKTFFQRVFNYFDSNNIKFPELTFDFHVWNRSPKTDTRGYLQIYNIIDVIKNFYKSYNYKDEQVTLTCMSTGAPARNNDEEIPQAVYMVKAYTVMLAEKVEKIYWTLSIDNPAERNIFASTGLLKSNLGKKMAYQTYKIMTERMGKIDFSTGEKVPHADKSVYIFKFINKTVNKVFLVAWKDGSESQEMDIPISISKYNVYDSISGEKKTTSDKNDSKTRNIRASLSDIPVYIEEF